MNEIAAVLGSRCIIYPGNVHFAAGVWKQHLISRRSTVQGLKRKDIKLLFSPLRDSFTFYWLLKKHKLSDNLKWWLIGCNSKLFLAHLLFVHSHVHCLCGGHLVVIRTRWCFCTAARRSSSVNICRYPSQPDCSLTVTDFCTEFIFYDAVTLYTLYVNKVRGSRVELFEWVFGVNR